VEDGTRCTTGVTCDIPAPENRINNLFMRSFFLIINDNNLFIYLKKTG